MGKIAPIAVLLMLLVPAAASADGFRFDAAFTPADFAELSDAVADALGSPSSGAAPLGITGFDLQALAGGPRVDTDSGWWRHGVDGSTTAGVLAAPRVLMRKGLPAGVDIGGQVGRVLGERFWGVELRWALLAGGAIEPAVGLRASYAKLENAPVSLDVKELQVVAEKGFPVITPYVAVGYRELESSAFFGDPMPKDQSVRRSRTTIAAGVRLHVLVLNLMAEVRQAAHQSIFIAAGLGW